MLFTAFTSRTYILIYCYLGYLVSSAIGNFRRFGNLRIGACAQGIVGCTQVTIVFDSVQNGGTNSPILPLLDPLLTRTNC